MIMDSAEKITAGAAVGRPAKDRVEKRIARLQDLVDSGVPPFDIFLGPTCRNADRIDTFAP
jgi:hypothetical protein